LDISVTPKKGRALLWPSTYDYDPSKIDPRMVHEAKPVVKGHKYAANSWIHLYDYGVPNLWGCTGSFEEL
jgi:prolyl 4-hydroxylase